MSAQTTSFFPRVKTAIGPFLKELEDKNQIFTFSKHPKNPYLTRKIRIKTKWVYEFFSSFGFGLKHSSAIFSTIQNAIWTRFKEVRDF